MESKDFSLMVDNETIKGVLENPASDKLIIIAHGFTGNMNGPDNLSLKFSKKLQEEGFAVVRFNFRGTPPSEGEFKDMVLENEIKDLKAVISEAKSMGYKKIGVLGKSMGGAVVVGAYDPSLKIVVFWYPAFDFINTAFRKYLTDKSSQELREKGFLIEAGFKIGKTFIEQIKHVNLYDTIKQIRCPVLFVHGDKDSDVPYEQSEKAFKLAKEPKELHIIKGAEHCFKNEQKVIMNLTLKFVKKYFS